MSLVRLGTDNATSAPKNENTIPTEFLAIIYICIPFCTRLALKHSDS